MHDYRYQWQWTSSNALFESHVNMFGRFGEVILVWTCIGYSQTIHVSCTRSHLPSKFQPNKRHATIPYVCIFVCTYINLHVKKTQILHDSQINSDQPLYPYWVYTPIHLLSEVLRLCSLGWIWQYDEPGTPLVIWPFVPSRWWPLGRSWYREDELIFAKSVDVRHDVINTCGSSRHQVL